MARERLCGQFIEFLSLARGCAAREPAVILTVRLNPARSFEPANLLLSVEQAIRLRDALNREFPVDTFPSNQEV